MIVDTVAKLLIALMKGIFMLVPTYELPAALANGAAGLGTVLAGVNGVFPIATLGLCLGFLVAVRLFLFAWDLIVFVYDRFPFKAS